ncbi:COMM domain-containing protein 9 [Rhincodon typus]|uniref:COMM domain-containing protein 9 n=1 Tax=Rhincodon typus TaxID=259920 RepID=UPI0020306D8C|nr:COMM domain-containing protein 9 [Rhincodon typus]
MLLVLALPRDSACAPSGLPRDSAYLLCKSTLRGHGGIHKRRGTKSILSGVNSICSQSKRVSFLFQFVFSLQLICSLHGFTRQVVFQGLTSAEEILPLFPDSFHQNLKNLLTKIIVENRAAWRNEALANQISLPQLTDMDWRVDIKTSSDNINRMAVPTCLLQMKIQDDVSACQGGPIISTVSLELSKEKLDTMLDGLGRIRDQLSAVANK